MEQVAWASKDGRVGLRIPCLFSSLLFAHIHESGRRQRGIEKSLVVPAFVFLALSLLHRDSVTQAINSLRVLPVAMYSWEVWQESIIDWFNRKERNPSLQVWACLAGHRVLSCLAECFASCTWVDAIDIKNPSTMGLCRGIDEDLEARSAQEWAKAAWIDLQSYLKEKSTTWRKTQHQATNTSINRSKHKKSKSKIIVKTSKLKFIPSHPQKQELNFQYCILKPPKSKIGFHSSVPIFFSRRNAFQPRHNNNVS